jgi:hypothetical protein
MLDVSVGSLDRARRVVTQGTDSLNAAVESGHVPLTTAARVAATWEPAKQDEFAEQVQQGADPRKIAPPDAPLPPISANDLRELEIPKDTGLLVRTSANKARDSVDDKREIITKLCHMVGGMSVAVSRITVLPPEITAEEAAVWRRELGALAELNRLSNLIRKRAKNV